MRVDVITDREGFDLLGPAWNRLLSEDCTGPLGLDVTESHEWACAMLDTFLANRRWMALVATDEKGVAAILPLYRATTYRKPLGPRELSVFSELNGGRNGLLVRNAEPGVLSQLLDHLHRHVGDWDSLRIRVVQGSRSERMLRAVLEQHSLKAIEFRREISPILRLPGEFDAWIDSLAPGLRAELRRRERRIREAGPLEFELCYSPDQVEHFWDSVASIERASWKEAAGTSITARPDQERFYRALLPRAAVSGQMLGGLLTLGGRPVAHSLALSLGGVAVGLKASYVQDMRKFSPSTLLRRMYLEAAHRRGIRYFDFSGEAEDHKLRWTSETYTLLTLDVFRHSLGGRLALVRARAAATSRSIADRVHPASMKASVHSTPRKVLLIAFHFPPFKGSSGLERTLAFSRNLHRFGWRPMVLSAHPRAYPAVSDERKDDIPADVRVERAFALDTSRHLAIGGSYPGWAALPDRWITWLAGAVPRGLRMIWRERPQAIWSTYPIATAHIIGWALHRLTGVPWIADFRDPMVEFNHREHVYAPPSAPLRRARLWIERRCARNASRVVFCTNGALEIFTSRYPDFQRERAVVIPNGYDEAVFASLPAVIREAQAGDARLKLLHSGVLYPGPDRDPTAFLRAVQGFLTEQPQWRSRLRIVLRATGFDSQYAPVIESLKLGDVVELAPPVPYRDALAEMLSADGLLVFQGYTSNPAIPAKVYEYLRARRPILALLDAEGDTAALLRSEHVGTILPIEDSAAISAGLGPFLERLVVGGNEVLSMERALKFERGHGAEALARLLSECTGEQVVAQPLRTEGDGRCGGRCR